MEEFSRTHCTRVATTIRWSESRRRRKRRRERGMGCGAGGEGKRGGR